MPKPKTSPMRPYLKKPPTRAYLKKLARMRGMWLGYFDGGYRLVYDERFSGDFAASFDNIVTKREDSQVRILLERAIAKQRAGIEEFSRLYGQETKSTSLWRLLLRIEADRARIWELETDRDIDHDLIVRQNATIAKQAEEIAELKARDCDCYRTHDDYCTLSKPEPESR